jgi:hypothetical protein
LTYSFSGNLINKVRLLSYETKPADEPGTRAEFTYHMTSATISITGKGRLSVGKDLEAVLRKIRTALDLNHRNSHPVVPISSARCDGTLHDR